MVPCCVCFPRKAKKIPINFKSEVTQTIPWMKDLTDLVSSSNPTQIKKGGSFSNFNQLGMCYRCCCDLDYLAYQYPFLCFYQNSLHFAPVFAFNLTKYLINVLQTSSGPAILANTNKNIEPLLQVISVFVKKSFITFRF